MTHDDLHQGAGEATDGHQSVSEAWRLTPAPDQWPTDKTTITYSFTAFREDSDTNRGDYFSAGMGSDGARIIRDAMAAWERVSGVRFRETGDQEWTYPVLVDS